MRSTLTSFACKIFAIGPFRAAFAMLLIFATPAMAQQQPQQPVTVPGPFQGLGNVLRNPDAPDPNRAARRPANPPRQPAPPPTIIPPGTLDNGAR